jgi:hypothetical protein
MTLFRNDHIEKFEFEAIPLGRQCLLMSENFMEEFSNALEKMLGGGGGNPYEVGFVSKAVVRKRHKSSLALSWYPNTYTRFHEVSIDLPKEKIKVAVECGSYDIDPYIFVDHEWLEQLHLRQYSVFALVDAIGVKNAIRDNQLSQEKLLLLRDRLDHLAELHKEISFVSLADTLILKSNWVVGYYAKGIKCSYQPETFFYVVKELEAIYKEVLGLEIYAILTQGSNEYYAEQSLHISKAQNHICLNSLGVPFAELLAIDNAVKKAIKGGIHPPMQLYMDEQFYHSVHFKYEFKKNDKPKSTYAAIMKPQTPHYFYSSCDIVISALEPRDVGH